MHRVKINLVTMEDVKNFVKIASTIPERVSITDGENYICNAKSILGCLAAMEWDQMYAESESDIYHRLEMFAE